MRKDQSGNYYIAKVKDKHSNEEPYLKVVKFLPEETEPENYVCGLWEVMTDEQEKNLSYLEAVSYIDGLFATKKRYDVCFENLLESKPRDAEDIKNIFNKKYNEVMRLRHNKNTLEK